jgi:hypothetical protein
LNADHTHFIFYEEEKNDINYLLFTNKIDIFLTEVLNQQIVSLIIRGDLSSIDAVEHKIIKEIPVIVIKGSGGVSDIIAFAFEEISEK